MGKSGGLDALVEANGNRTSWERDLVGRVAREVRADGVTDTTSMILYDLLAEAGAKPDRFLKANVGLSSSEI